jgi:diadenosine tetraphosphate (Ap4A) HIT family hydrolase
VTPSDTECYSCRSISGVKRISPGPTIYEGQHWVVEHAYPCAMLGWLVIVLKRHVEALHDLTPEEFAELGSLLERTARALHSHLGTRKEYVACYAEAEHFNHVHTHVVARSEEWPQEFKGPRSFRLLDENHIVPVAPPEVDAFCRAMQVYFR